MRNSMRNKLKLRRLRKITSVRSPEAAQYGRPINSRKASPTAVPSLNNRDRQIR